MQARYQIDQAVAAEISRKIVLGYGQDHLSREEIANLQALTDALDSGGRRDWIQEKDELSHLVDVSEQQYDEGLIGSWSAAGFRVLAMLGVSIIDWHEMEARIRGFSSLVSRILMAQVRSTEYTLDTIDIAVLDEMVKIGMGSQVVRVLEGEKKEHEVRIKIAQESKSINEWLRGVGSISPLTYSQLLIYRCFKGLILHRRISEADLCEALGIDKKVRLAEENRLEEIGAHTYGQSVGLYKDDPSACENYIMKIVRKSNTEDKRSARRQVKFDFARLMLPRFLMEDALNAIG